MPRLRNSTTGVVLNVSDETAAALVGNWESPDAPKRGRRPAAKKSEVEDASGSDNA